jgi:ornithine carbamoyltransferase
VDDFAQLSGIPTINALTDDEHPCQILADLQTIDERLGSFVGKTVTFVGDGACNVPASWLWAAAKLGFELRIASPKAFQPSPQLIARAFPGAKPGVQEGSFSNDQGGCLVVTSDLEAAARGADVLYTDVWVSMGKESESDYRLAQLGGYQINQKLVSLAKPGALVMHCLPAYRGKEITEETFETHADTIFAQAENRLHAQKAVLALVAGG